MSYDTDKTGNGGVIKNLRVHVRPHTHTHARAHMHACRHTQKKDRQIWKTLFTV